MKTKTATYSIPTAEEIQQVAFQLWIDNGQPAGRDLDHWLIAEELLNHRPQPVRSSRRLVAPAHAHSGKN